MPTQAELTGDGLSLDLFEASLDEGQVRRQNHPAGQVQRKVITDRSPTSQYKVQVVLAACVHGFLDAAQTEPASLILVDYNLNATARGAVFASLDTSFEFQPYPPGAGDVEAPQVIAYAPFKEPVRLNPSTAKKSKEHQPSAKLSPQVAGIGGEVAYTGKRAEEHEQKYFDLAQGGRDFDAQARLYRVWWNVVHNPSQKLGIPPKLRLAMLVERASRDDKFQAVFSIALEGGVGYALSQLKEKWLRKTTFDDPVIFDPAASPMLGELEDELVEAGVLKWDEAKPATVEQGGGVPVNPVPSQAAPGPSSSQPPPQEGDGNAAAHDTALGQAAPTQQVSEPAEPIVVRREANKTLTIQPFEKLRKRERLDALSYVWGLAPAATGTGEASKGQS